MVYNGPSDFFLLLKGWRKYSFILRKETGKLISLFCVGIYCFPSCFLKEILCYIFRFYQKFCKEGIVGNTSGAVYNGKDV